MNAGENLRAALWSKGPYGPRSAKRSDWVSDLIEAYRAEVTHAAARAVADFTADDDHPIARMLHDRADGAPGAGDPQLGVGS